MTRVQLIFANYGCADDIKACIGSLPANGGAVRIDVLVVNNGGDPFEASMVSLPAHCTLNILTPSRNVGYFGAAVEALVHDTTSGAPDFRILCNPDIEFTDPAFFTKLAGLELPQSVAMIAPAVVSGISGADQNPYLSSRPGPALMGRWRLVYSSWLVYAAYGLLSHARLRLLRARPRPGARPARGTIYAPHGAFIVFANRFLENASGLADIPFLFAEELFLGEICLREGREVLYLPELEVRHVEHATTARIGTRQRFRLQRDALFKYLAMRRPA
jgi:GT2 family glycosyltransferase